MALAESNCLAVVRKVVGLLAHRRYEDIEVQSDGVRLKAADMRAAIDAYPGCVIEKLRPEDVDVIRIEGSKDASLSINVRLHTNLESPSDLTLSMTLVQETDCSSRFEVDDIHVL